MRGIPILHDAGASVMHSLVWIVMDSCRYDSFQRARTPTTDRFVAANRTHVQRRFSYASWTAPSHYTFLMGMVPHTCQAGVFASAVYKGEFSKWSDRLGTSGLDFTSFLPNLSLPKVLKELGYRTIARVSLPVLNQLTLLSTHFDDYRLMDDHNDFAGMIDEMAFADQQPRFYFFNLGETHYPYMLEDANLPRITGVHGVFRELGQGQSEGGVTAFFDQALMDRLREQQIRCVEHVDALFNRLLDKCPPQTHVILTADHGELFGEDNYFGHGPIVHEKVFEVPFVEGTVKMLAQQSSGHQRTVHETL